MVTMDFGKRQTIAASPAEPGDLPHGLDAIRLHYEVSEDDLGGRLFIAGREIEVVIATNSKMGIINFEPVVANIEVEIRDKKIDVHIVDPFVSSHNIPENDDTAIARAASAWAGIADRCDLPRNTSSIMSASR